MDFLKRWPARILAVLLLLQAVAYYAVASRREIIPNVAPLSVFPPTSQGWTVQHEYPIDDEVQKVLKADDTLNRVYVSSDGRMSASLMIAFFRTQRYGQAPHSPKNCLPGAGWQPLEDTKVAVDIPGRGAPIVINKYVIAHANEQSIVMYWYQSHNRVIAGEFAAKFWLIADAVRYSRSDTALVRVIVPVSGNRNAAENAAVNFVRAVYPDVIRQFPD
jgi:EpsI family protein